MRRNRVTFYLIGTVFAAHSGSLFACIAEDGSSNPTFFLIVSSFALLLLAFLSWAINKLFVNRRSLFSLFLIATVLISLFLGMLGTFVIPEFEDLFAGIGADLPPQTQLLLGVRQYLWLPALLVLVLWYTSRKRVKRTRYFGAALFIEIYLLFLIFWALYSPVFKMGIVC